MESLSLALQPYKELIATVASYVTIAQFFSGAFICKDIWKKGNTCNISSTPFVGGIVVGLAMLRYAILLKDAPMLTVNVSAIGLNILYCLFYYIYSSKKWDEIIKSLTIGIPLVAILWGYCDWEDPTLIEYRYGMIVTIMMLSLLGVPLLDVKKIVAEKDASQIPFVLTLMGTIVTFLWLLYGIILLNQFMLVQNVLGFALCSVQLALIFVYPAKPARKSKRTKKGAKRE